MKIFKHNRTLLISLFSCEYTRRVLGRGLSPNREDTRLIFGVAETFASSEPDDELGLTSHAMMFDWLSHGNLSWNQVSSPPVSQYPTHVAPQMIQTTQSHAYQPSPSEERTNVYILSLKPPMKTRPALFFSNMKCGGGTCTRCCSCGFDLHLVEFNHYRRSSVIHCQVSTTTCTKTSSELGASERPVCESVSTPRWCRIAGLVVMSRPCHCQSRVKGITRLAKPVKQN